MGFITKNLLVKQDVDLRLFSFNNIFFAIREQFSNGQINHSVYVKCLNNLVDCAILRDSANKFLIN